MGLRWGNGVSRSRREGVERYSPPAQLPVKALMVLHPLSISVVVRPPQQQLNTLSANATLRRCNQVVDEREFLGRW